MTPLRLHVVSLPHTQTTERYNACAYTTKVRRFATMMRARGHEVFLYAGDENEADCTELVPCITRADQERLLTGTGWWERGEWAGVSWDAQESYWRLFQRNVIREMRKRARPRDILCFITGLSMDEAIKAFPAHLRVEFGVGYEGVHPDTWHVFESYAWMHMLYGHLYGPLNANGRYFDAVIPNYFAVEDFPFSDRKGDYYLFMSRMVPRKGYRIAIDACERAQKRLLIAGVGGDRPESPVVEYVGYADTARRASLLRHARAVFMPTVYVEPFGGVAAEALMCGTPVISTDFGAFAELVEHGVDGYRCKSMREFVAAMALVGDLDYQAIHDRAVKRFSTDVVAALYEDYFVHLGTLWKDGFDEW